MATRSRSGGCVDTLKDEYFCLVTLQFELSFIHLMTPFMYLEFFSSGLWVICQGEDELGVVGV